MNAQLKAKLLKPKAKKKVPWGQIVIVAVCAILSWMHFDAMFSSHLPPTPIQYIVSLFIVLTVWVLLAKRILLDGKFPIGMDP